MLLPRRDSYLKKVEHFAPIVCGKLIFYVTYKFNKLGIYVANVYITKPIYFNPCYYMSRLYTAYM